MHVSTIVNHLSDCMILVHILELIQQRNHMFVSTVVSHLANRLFWINILELIQKKNYMIVNIVLNPFTVSCVFPCTPWYRVIYILLFRCYYCFIANEAIGDVMEIGAKQYKYIHTTYIESNDIWHYTINIEFQYILITPHQFTSIKT